MPTQKDEAARKREASAAKKKAAKKVSAARRTAKVDVAQAKGTVKRDVASAKRKVAKKASTARKATKKTAQSNAGATDAPKNDQKAGPQQVHAKQESRVGSGTDALFEQLNAFADKAVEQASVIGRQVYETAAELGKQAEAEIDKGKKFIREHQTEAVLGALTAATVAGLAAARATYKTVRRR